MSQAPFTLQGHNPDVLTCIANLSNDEVFTPVEVASQMLDTLEETWARANQGEILWANRDLTFLDPCTKSGIFLREIVKRLNRGLVAEIPDLAERIDHIVTKQVFGIGITQLTSLLARRSIYCSKVANGVHSVARSFKNDAGNIWYERIEHSWASGKCIYCNASEREYARSESLETYAYAFTHCDDVKTQLAEMFGGPVHFDVVIGNPPYQLSDGGSGGSAVPIYHQFIQQAIELDPRMVVMVTPSRWFAGGRGLDNFRAQSLSDHRFRVVVDFLLEKDAFPNVNISGGVNYFLWERDFDGECEITTVAPGGKRGTPLNRSLDEFDIFVRRNEAIPILRKILAKNEESFEARVSSLKPFGLRTFFHGSDHKSTDKNIKLYGSGKVTWVAKSELTANAEWSNRWKVLVPRATDGNEKYPLPIWDQVGPFVSAPKEACTETYLIASLAEDKIEAENIVRYMQTKFFRFLVSLRKGTQDNKAANFSFVPDVPLDRVWTDADLYRRYSLDENDICFIESTIRDMKFANE
jgi:hypothetical protein